MSQSITVNQVTLTVSQATKVVSANANRTKAVLVIQGQATNTGNYFVGTSNSVSPSNGFPFLPTANDGSMTLDWQTDIWIFNSNVGYANPQCYFIDEASS